MSWRSRTADPQGAIEAWIKEAQRKQREQDRNPKRAAHAVCWRRVFCAARTSLADSPLECARFFQPFALSRIAQSCAPWRMVLKTRCRLDGDSLNLMAIRRMLEMLDGDSIVEGQCASGWVAGSGRPKREWTRAGRVIVVVVQDTHALRLYMSASGCGSCSALA